MRLTDFRDDRINPISEAANSRKPQYCVNQSDPFPRLRSRRAGFEIQPMRYICHVIERYGIRPLAKSLPRTLIQVVRLKFILAEQNDAPAAARRVQGLRKPNLLRRKRARLGKHNKRIRPLPRNGVCEATKLANIFSINPPSDFASPNAICTGASPRCVEPAVSATQSASHRSIVGPRKDSAVEYSRMSLRFAASCCNVSATGTPPNWLSSRPKMPERR
jgi:hypothetical protein